MARRRLNLFMAAILAIGVALLARLAWLQVVEAEVLQRRADRQYRARVTLDPYRGTIYDRAGRPLTDNLSDWVSIGINPYHVANPARLSRELARVTGRPARQFLERLKRRGNYVVLARQVPPEQARLLASSGWNLCCQPEIHRTFPQGCLAGQLVGFTDIDNRGISGLELTFDDILRGKPGWRIVQLDVEGRQHLDKSLPFESQRNGGDLILTIDLPIQSILEEELLLALDYHRARSAAGLVIDPGSGEVIAMASVPRFDPNHPEDFEAARQKNLPITEMFEPGSTFKVVPATLLLERSLVTPQTEIDCGNGKITIYDKTIHDVHPYDRLSFRDVIVKSSNVGMINATHDVDHDALFEKVFDFGFLTETGVEFVGEAGGRLPPPKEWSGLTRPNIVIGYGVAVTMMQLAMAYGAIANEGVLMKPTLVRGVCPSGGKFKRNETVAVRRVVSKKVARCLTDILVGVVEKGTGRNAAIDGMPVAGKTGTSLLVNQERGGYYDDRYIASFVGYFPARNPRYLIMAMVSEPRGGRGEYTGGSVAAPIFRRVAERIIGLKPELWALVDEQDRCRAGEAVTVPDVTFCSLGEAKSRLGDVGLKLRCFGSGEAVYDQVPAAGTVVVAGDEVRVTLGPREPQPGPTIIMPVLTDLSLRDAVKKATESGLMVRVSGSGRVVSQSPPSGSKVPIGEICRIHASG